MSPASRPSRTGLEAPVEAADLWCPPFFQMRDDRVVDHSVEALLLLILFFCCFLLRPLKNRIRRADATLAVLSSLKRYNPAWASILRRIGKSWSFIAIQYLSIAFLCVFFGEMLFFMTNPK